MKSKLFDSKVTLNKTEVIKIYNIIQPFMADLITSYRKSLLNKKEDLSLPGTTQDLYDFLDMASFTMQLANSLLTKRESSACNTSFNFSLKTLLKCLPPHENLEVFFENEDDPIYMGPNKQMDSSYLDYEVKFVMPVLGEDAHGREEALLHIELAKPESEFENELEIEK